MSNNEHNHEGYMLHLVEKDVLIKDDKYYKYNNRIFHISMYINYLSDIKLVKIVVNDVNTVKFNFIYNAQDYEDMMNRYNFYKECIFDQIEDGINIGWFYTHGFDIVKEDFI